MKHIPETTPINFVVQAKMSGNAIPHEYGYNKKEDAEEMVRQIYNSGNPKLRWLDIKEMTEKQYTEHHKKQGSEQSPKL